MFSVGIAKMDCICCTPGTQKDLNSKYHCRRIVPTQKKEGLS